VAELEHTKHQDPGGELQDIGRYCLLIIEGLADELEPAGGLVRIPAML
jgi:hypothetical protein